MVSSEVINACPDYNRPKPRLKRLFRIVIINLIKYFHEAVIQHFFGFIFIGSVP